jgi:hypothetical protein
VFEVLLTIYPRVFGRLNWGQRLSYAVRTTNYLIGPIIFIHIAVTIAALFEGNRATQANLQQYYLHLTPLAVAEVVIRYLAFQRWRHTSIPTESLWRALVLVYVSWPVYTLAWLMAMLRLPLSFRPTPKKSKSGVNPLWLLPQLISLLLLVAGIIYAVMTTPEAGFFLLLYSFAVCLAIPQVGIFRPLLRSIFVKNQTASKPEVLGSGPVARIRQFWS